MRLIKLWNRLILGSLWVKAAKLTMGQIESLDGESVWQARSQSHFAEQSNYKVNKFIRELSKIEKKLTKLNLKLTKLSRKLNKLPHKFTTFIYRPTKCNLNLTKFTKLKAKESSPQFAPFLKRFPFKTM
jgi:predicted transcriptional regulator